MGHFARLCSAASIVLAAVGLPSTGSIARATPSDLSGVYSSVRYVAEAGDDLGMEIELQTMPRPVAVVTICEGACRGGKIWPVFIDGRKIRFTVVEPLNDQDGKPAKPLMLSFEGQFKGNLLVVRMPGYTDMPAERLKRVAHPKPGQTARLGCNAAAC